MLPVICLNACYLTYGLSFVNVITYCCHWPPGMPHVFLCARRLCIFILLVTRIEFPLASGTLLWVPARTAMVHDCRAAWARHLGTLRPHGASCSAAKASALRSPPVSQEVFESYTRNISSTSCRIEVVKQTQGIFMMTVTS